TVLLHEMGHILGFSSDNPGFVAHVGTINGSQLFVGPGFTAALSPDGEHLDATAYPNDLMNTTLAPSVRKLPSALDGLIIRAVRGLEAAPTSSLAVSTAHSSGESRPDSLSA